MNQKSNKVNKFWKGYYEAVVESGIPEKTAEWYANWAQKKVKTLKNAELCLKTHFMKCFLLTKILVKKFRLEML